MARLILCLCLGLLTAPALGKVVYLGYPSPNSGATTMGAQMAPAVVRWCSSLPEDSPQSSVPVRHCKLYR